MTNKERDEKVWTKFILLIAVDSFGMPEVLAGKVQRNLLGSVDHHKKIFMQAANEIDVESEIVK
jgi:hypothetical protein